jgi:hypothetical protein
MDRQSQYHPGEECTQQAGAGLQQGNLLSSTRRPDAARGGDQTSLHTTYAYEPIYNQCRSVVDARYDASYVPQNSGQASARRYQASFVFDYQEGSDLARLATATGVPVAAVESLLAMANVPLGLGDVNGDGRIDQIAGNVVRIQMPSASLQQGEGPDDLAHTGLQAVEILAAYNDAGQMTRHRDAEGNVTLFAYYSREESGGPALDAGVPARLSWGFLKQVLRDVVGDPDRNSRTNPPPAVVRQMFGYDRAGHVIRRLDGRGVATEYVVNALNQIVQIVSAAAHDGSWAFPAEPRSPSTSAISNAGHTTRTTTSCGSRSRTAATRAASAAARLPSSALSGATTSSIGVSNVGIRSTPAASWSRASGTTPTNTSC